MSCNEECGCQDTCFVVTTHTSSYLHMLHTLYKLQVKTRVMLSQLTPAHSYTRYIYTLQVKTRHYIEDDDCHLLRGGLGH